MSELDPAVPAPADSPAPAPVAATQPPDFAQWRPLPPEAAQTAMIGGSAISLLIGAGLCFFVGWPLSVASDFIDLAWWQGLLLMFVPWLGFGAVGALIAYRRWQSTAWKLDDTGLHLRRGRMWRKEVLVPLSRVQHLDIERGPIERRYGLASLVVHTAGTRQHALRLAGLPDAEATALRDSLVPDAGRHDDVL
jgi:hypothetical protein